MDDESKIVELYKLAKFLIKKRGYTYSEDLVQDLVTYAHSKLSMYDESRGTWATYVIMCMNCKALMNFRNESSSKRKGVTVSIDTPFNDTLTFNDVLPSSENVDKDTEKERILKLITPLIEEPLRLMLQGVAQYDIAERLGISQSYVSRLISNNIQKIKDFCKAKGIDYEI